MIEFPVWKVNKEQLIMHNFDNKEEKVSREEAQALLKGIAEVKREAVNSVSPPWWLNLLLSTSYGMIFVSYKIDRKAAWLLVPYLLWVTFAGVLNVGFL